MNTLTALKKIKHHRNSPRSPGYSITQFARMFDLSVSSVRSAIKNGEITAIKFNGIPRIPWSEKQRFIDVWGLREEAERERLP